LGAPEISVILASMILEHELELALALVERCGTIAADIQAGGAATLQTSDKPDDQGPVTRADIAVETAIVAALREQFPDDAILAEERAQDPQWRTASRVWMIDPIDGTRDFAGGDRSWAIHVGLTLAGRPALGIVHEPGNQRTSWAVLDGELGHAWTRAWTRHDSDPAPQALGLGQAAERLPPRWTMVTSKSHRSGRSDELAELLGLGPEQQLRTGSTGVKLALVARGEAEMYAHPTAGTKLWDSCAPEVILHAAGGRLTDMLGQPLRYRGPEIGNDRGLLASGPGVDHDALVARLQPLTTVWFPTSR
jgi:3'-phosphoadenosine 5'-phosphosulfate (PAPS) 3'-phosphatase